jgi:hypothetical protein
MSRHGWRQKGKRGASLGSFSCRRSDIADGRLQKRSEKEVVVCISCSGTATANKKQQETTAAVRVVVVVVAGHGAGSGRVWSQSKEIAREAVQWSTRSESLVSETWASDWPCPQREPSVVGPSAWVPFRVVVGELLLLAHHSASYALT